MDFVKIVYEPGYYDCSNTNCIRMYILGMFLAREVGRDVSFFKEWFLIASFMFYPWNEARQDITIPVKEISNYLNNRWITIK